MAESTKTAATMAASPDGEGAEPQSRPSRRWAIGRLQLVRLVVVFVFELAEPWQAVAMPAEDRQRSESRRAHADIAQVLAQLVDRRDAQRPRALADPVGVLRVATGTVKGSFKGTSAFGAKLSVPTVIATSVVVVSATAAAPRAINTYRKATYTQFRITVTIQKVEFAASETRVFVKVKNASGYNASIYDSAA